MSPNALHPSARSIQRHSVVGSRRCHWRARRISRNWPLRGPGAGRRSGVFVSGDDHEVPIGDQFDCSKMDRVITAKSMIFGKLTGSGGQGAVTSTWSRCRSNDSNSTTADRS